MKSRNPRKIDRYIVGIFTLFLASIAVGNSVEDRIDRLGALNVADEVIQCGGFHYAIEKFIPELTNPAEVARRQEGYLELGHFILTNHVGMSQSEVQQHMSDKMMEVVEAYSLALEENDMKRFLNEQRANCEIHEAFVLSMLAE